MRALSHCHRVAQQGEPAENFLDDAAICQRLYTDGRGRSEIWSVRFVNEQVRNARSIETVSQFFERGFVRDFKNNGVCIWRKISATGFACRMNDLCGKEADWQVRADNDVVSQREVNVK